MHAADTVIASADTAISTSAPVLQDGAEITLEPWQAEWLSAKLDGIARRARRSGVESMPRLVAKADAYPVWCKVRGDAWKAGRVDGCCIVVDASAGERCEAGVCPVHWEQTMFQDFRIEGSMPVMPGGWHLLAAIDRVAGVGAIVREAPGHTCPAEFRGDDAANRCDHCNTRRPRGKVYVIANADGHAIQVGSTCIAEFIRDPNVAAAIDAILSAQAAWAGVPREDEDGNPLVGRGEHVRPLETYLQHVAAYTRDNHGVYVTKAAAQGRMSTADSAWAAQEARDAKERRNHPDLRKPVDAATSVAAIAWARALPVNGSAFEQNMRTMATAGAFHPKHMGTAAYIVPAFQRAQGAQAAARTSAAAPVRLAAVEGAKKVVRNVEVIRKAAFDSQYGDTYITAMRVVDGADAGAVVVWKSKDTPWVRSADSHRTVAVSIGDAQHDAWAQTEIARGKGTRTPAKVGDRLTIEFTVKSHTEYKGKPESQILRVAVVCDGWGYAAAPDSDEARLAARMIAEGRNAPPAPASKPRRSAKAA